MVINFILPQKNKKLNSLLFILYLDSLINGLDERFNQETVNIISAMNDLLNLDISKPDLNILSNYFKFDKDE